MSESRELSTSELHIVQHSLGLDRYGKGRMYRNHFVASEGSTDHGICLALVEAGLMSDGKTSALTGDNPVFFVTDAGKQKVVQCSPVEPKKTRGQARYRRWLDADSSLSFGEWLKIFGGAS